MTPFSHRRGIQQDVLCQFFTIIITASNYRVVNKIIKQPFINHIYSRNYAKHIIYIISLTPLNSPKIATIILLVLKMTDWHLAN